jgi:hypothetical protein
MKRLLLLGSILLLSAVFALAQYGSQPSGTASSDLSMTTIQGCLAGSTGSYSLTDKSGTTYQLTGDTAKLQAHVGHTISVTGTTTPSAGSASAAGQSGSMSAPADGQPTFSVTSFKHVSPSCSAMQ